MVDLDNVMSDPDGLFMDAGSITEKPVNLTSVRSGAAVPDAGAAAGTVPGAAPDAASASVNAAPSPASVPGVGATPAATVPMGGQAQAQAPAPVPAMKQELPSIADATANAADSAFENLDVGETMEYTFFDALPEEKQKQFLNNAAKTILKEFIKDNTQIVVFGSSALEGVNAITDEILKYNSNAEIPQVDAILEDANRRLDDFAEKGREYREEAKKKQNRFVQWVKGTKRAHEDFRFTQKDLVERFRIISEKIIVQSNQIADGYYQMKKLRDKNRESIVLISGVLAMFEAVHIVTMRNIQTLQERIAGLESNSPEYHKQHERLQALAMVANTLQKQHANYMARWLIAQATTEQVNSSIRLSMEIITKLKMTVSTTIPTMKLIVAQIAQLNAMAEAGKSLNAMQDSFDKTLDMYRKSIETTIPELERSAQKEPMTEEQVMALAESIKKSNEDVVTAIVEGRKKRMGMERAILTASEQIRESSDKMNERLVSSLIGNDENGLGEEEISSAMFNMENYASKAAYDVFK